MAWRAFNAVRKATPWSQLARESLLRMEDATRARTRNVAWKASSASCSWSSTERQTPNTSRPCRSIRAAKAAPSFLVTKHSRRWKSLWSAGFCLDQNAYKPAFVMVLCCIPCLIGVFAPGDYLLPRLLAALFIAALVTGAVLFVRHQRRRTKVYAVAWTGGFVHFDGRRFNVSSIPAPALSHPLRW